MSTEREDLKQEIKGILAQLENESFRNEVLKELKEASASGKRTNPLQHPAFLLVLGFFLTGVVGTWLTTHWEAVAKQREQEKAAHERAMKQKYEITDQINKTEAEGYTAIHVILNVIVYGPPTKDAKEISEREAYWNKTRREWIINQRVLRQKLAVSFKDEEAAPLYEEIISDGDEAAAVIIDTLNESKKQSLTEADTRVMKDQIIKMGDDLQAKTERLLRLLVDEIDEEESAGS